MAAVQQNVMVISVCKKLHLKNENLAMLAVAKDVRTLRYFESETISKLRNNIRFNTRNRNLFLTFHLRIMLKIMQEIIFLRFY